MKLHTFINASFSRKALLATLALAGIATAAPLPKEGTYEYVSCWSGVGNDIVFSKTHTANSYEMTGTIVSSVPGGLLDNSTFRCVGMNTMMDSKAGGGNVCEAVDKDGDKRLTRFTIAADGKVSREAIAGTGKYEGLVTTSTVTMIGPFPSIKAGTFQGCNRQSGTYKLK